MACEAKRLVIHHHDPNNDDKKLKDMEVHAMREAVHTPLAGKVVFAREGEVYEL